MPHDTLQHSEKKNLTVVYDFTEIHTPRIKLNEFQTSIASLHLFIALHEVC